jgi:hypothetical protein
MRRIIVTALLAFAVAPVAASVAAGGTDATKAASATCAASKARLGATTFAQAYTSFGACVSAMTSVEQQNIASAQALCAVEQGDTVGFAVAHGGKTFAQFYGTGKNDKNALAKCASIKAQASSKAEQLARTNPSRSCRTLRTQTSVSAFALRFGTASNAFGKCVSWAAGLQTQSENAASPTCRTAQDASATTFATSYGSSANAFGKCVSSNASVEAKAKLQATIAATTACAAERTANAAAFNAKYGSFKSCVAQNTKTA